MQAEAFHIVCMLNPISEEYIYIHFCNYGEYGWVIFTIIKSCTEIEMCDHVEIYVPDMLILCFLLHAY